MSKKLNNLIAEYEAKRNFINYQIESNKKTIDINNLNHIIELRTVIEMVINDLKSLI